MDKLIEWAADQILKSVDQDGYDEFLAALRDRREEVIEGLAPQMCEMPERYVLSHSEDGALVTNADSGDPNVFFTIAKRVVDHLRESLLDDVKQE